MDKRVAMDDFKDRQGKPGRTDLNLLVIFRAVARRRSVTLAAEDLSLSQPAVSHAINRFRDIVRDPLFIRSSRGLALTPRAEVLLDAVGPALSVIEQALHSSDFDAATDKYLFNLGTSEYANRVIMPAVVAAARRHAPHCQIHAMQATATAFDDLLSGKIDLLFFGDEIKDRHFQSETLFTEEYVVMLSATHPALAERSPDAISLEGYLAYPHARFSINDGIKGPIDRVLEAMGRKRSIGFSSASFAAAVEVAAGSDIICSLPSRLARSCTQPGLVCLPLPFKVPPYSYHMVWDPRTNSNPALRWLRSQILVHFQRPQVQQGFQATG